MTWNVVIPFATKETAEFAKIQIRRELLYESSVVKDKKGSKK
jgi:hypothetical protein